MRHRTHTVTRSALLSERARLMRHQPTESESRLWSQLAARRLGVTFRRQVVVGRAITDFCAPAAKVVVEVDGRYHARRRRTDARRDAKLCRLGYRVVRLSAELVMRDLPAAVAQVRAALEQPP